MILSESIRLTFAFEGEKIALKSASRLTMRAPIGERNVAKDIDPNLVGRWVEIRGKKKQPLYRKLVHRFMLQDVEIQSSDRETPLRHTTTQLKKGIFHILIPAVDGSRELILCEQEAPAKKGGCTRVIEHVCIDLTKINYSKQQDKKEDQ